MSAHCYDCGSDLSWDERGVMFCPVCRLVEERNELKAEIERLKSGLKEIIKKSKPEDEHICPEVLEELMEAKR